MKVKKWIWVALLALTAIRIPNPLPGKEPTAPEPLLSLERIFSSNEFAAERFGPAKWWFDGISYTLLENSPGIKGGQDIVLCMAAGSFRRILVGAEQLIPPGAATPLTVEEYQWSADSRRLLIFTNSQRVWRQNTRGDYWVWDRVSGTLKKLGGSLEASQLMFAKFSPDNRRVAYIYKNNLCAEDLESGRITPLTSDGSATVSNGSGDWVYEEEFYLRDGFRWSPDSHSIAFWQLDSSAIPDYYLINNTDSLYPKISAIKYPKAGTSNSSCRIGVVAAQGGPVTWLQVPGDPRENYIPRLQWNPDSKEIMLQHLNRLQNTNDVLLADRATGKVRTIFSEKDAAWVEVVDDWRWLERGKRFLWLSERDGWNHVYAVSRQGQFQLLTPGAFDVIGVAGVDETNGWLYYTASPDNPSQRYLYRTRLYGNVKPEQLSPASAKGSHSYQLSPSCTWAFHTFSSFDNPPLTDLVSLPDHRPRRVLVENRSLREKVTRLKRAPAEFFRIDIGGGVKLDAWLLKPPDFNPGKSYPLLFHVYGEPSGQTVLDRWGGATYLWHLLLAQKGYIVASVDNRGTPAPRGRDWRKSIYRQIGILASADQAAATRQLLHERPYIDPARVGIWGWSGGGQMTLNALFRYPAVYKVGMAVAFVSDQRLYDTIYQERYMRRPQDNPEGYRDGSPITFAKQLQGNLLLVHGTGDDNVHYQSFEMLVNELIKYNKRFWMMSYPNRTHGIFEGPGTTRHLYETLTAFLLEHLPPGAKKNKE